MTSGTPDQIAQQFEANRGHLRAVAYRMLGSLSDADDVVQDAWLRLTGSDTSRVENLKAWLTTVVARLCLDALRSRKTRDDGTVHVPDPIVSQPDRRDPEHEALLADSVSLAVLVVLETLGPDERLAFVLHDMFDVPFSEIARIVRRSPAAARQLASRARRRVRGAAVPSSADLARQREVIDAFVAAARAGDFEALIAVLDPDVVLRADRGVAGPQGSRVTRGAQAVAAGAIQFSARFAGRAIARHALVNGTPGLVSVDPQGQPISVVGFTVRDGRITELNILADPARLRRLDLAFER